MKKKLDHILLGCVADDFTGASDAASFLAKQGIKTLLFNGIPKDTEVVRDCAAVVIALKTRSIAASGAVRDTLAALECLGRMVRNSFTLNIVQPLIRPLREI